MVGGSWGRAFMEDGTAQTKHLKAWNRQCGEFKKGQKTFMSSLSVARRRIV